MKPPSKSSESRLRVCSQNRGRKSKFLPKSSRNDFIGSIKMHSGSTDNSFGNLQVFIFRFGNRGIALQTTEYEYDLLTSLSAFSVCVSIHSDSIVNWIMPMLTKLVTFYFHRRLPFVSLRRRWNCKKHVGISSSCFWPKVFVLQLFDDDGLWLTNIACDRVET